MEMLRLVFLLLLSSLSSGLALKASGPVMRVVPMQTRSRTSPLLLLSKLKRAPPPPPALAPTPKERGFGGALQRLQGSPTRAVMALVYVCALYYVVGGGAPPAQPEQTVALIQECVDPASIPSIFFVVFNSLGIMPALYAATLLPGAKNQSPLPAAPFLAAAFFAGYGATGPYLALRQPRTEPVACSDLGFIARTITESRLFGGTMVLTSLLLLSKLLAIEDWDAAISVYRKLFDSSQLVNVSSFDLLVLSAFFFEPAREDMQRRGWYAAPSEQPTTIEILRLASFCAVPVLGPALYVLLRPSLPKE